MVNDLNSFGGSDVSRATNSFVDVTYTSWSERIVQSLSGIIIGILVIFGAFVLIFWNEGRSVERIRALAEGQRLVVSVSSDEVDASRNTKLIHTSGTATTTEVLEDVQFGVKKMR